MLWGLGKEHQGTQGHLILEGLIEEEASSELEGCIEFWKAGQGILW